MMGPHRVVITGAGAFSALGAGAESLWAACRDGVSGVHERNFERIPDQKVMQSAGISDELLRAHVVHERRQCQRSGTGVAKEVPSGDHSFVGYLRYRKESDVNSETSIALKLPPLCT